MNTLPPKLARLVQQANQALQARDLATALTHAREAQTLAPENAGATMTLVMVLNQAGNAREALALIERLDAGAKQVRGPAGKTFRAAVQAQKGIALQKLGKLREAVKAFEAAHKLTPNAELSARIARIKPLANCPEAVQQLVLSAREKVTAGEPAEALPLYEAALKLHPDNVLALHECGLLHRRLGQVDVALPLLQRAVMVEPDRPDLFNDLGLLFQDRQDYAKAVSFHKRALKADPNFVYARINLGVAYKRLNQPEDAILAYQAALAIAPDMPEVHNNLGNLFRLEGHVALARQHLSRAIALAPNYADAKQNLALLDEAHPPAPVSAPDADEDEEGADDAVTPVDAVAAPKPARRSRSKAGTSATDKATSAAKKPARAPRKPRKAEGTA